MAVVQARENAPLYDFGIHPILQYQSASPELPPYLPRES
jgi:hypothetical protein